ncbi:MAG TPA: carboxypeptidase-like regulatory domain-containing protein [Fibrobacteria bacterium]|nr:carboxypeptidase-like regulatory domain-containing protein [Fibrobacteria bacterium]
MGLRGGWSGKASGRGWLGPAAFFAYAFWLSVLGCSSGTEVQDPYELAGRVVHENGEPAVNVTVVAMSNSPGSAKTSASPLETGEADSKTVLTDSKGEFKFDSLPRGISFDLIFEDTSAPLEVRESWRRFGIRPPKGSVLTLKPVKLRPPGEVFGTVIDYADKTNIDSARCQVDGTPYSTFTKLGVFHFNLGGGEREGDTGQTGVLYEITCEKSPYSSGTIFVEVNPSQSKQVQISLDMGEGEIQQPVPATVAAGYDPATGVVTLTWNRVAYAQHVLYGIRRGDSVLVGPTEQFTSIDTVFRDVVYYGQTDTVSRKVLKYTVHSLRKDLIYRTGTPALRVEATRPTSHGADLALRFPDRGNPSQVGDTALLIGSYRNVFRNNKSLQWMSKDPQDSLLRKVDLTGRSGEDTLVFPCTGEGKFEIGFQVTDSAGITTSLFKTLEIKPAP